MHMNFVVDTLKKLRRSAIVPSIVFMRCLARIFLHLHYSVVTAQDVT